jgi:hypothetical protein
LYCPALRRYIEKKQWNMGDPGPLTNFLAFFILIYILKIILTLIEQDMFVKHVCPSDQVILTDFGPCDQKINKG